MCLRGLRLSLVLAFGGFLFTRLLSSICSTKIKRVEGFVGATCPNYWGLILKDGPITCAGTNCELTCCTPDACAATGLVDVGRVFSWWGAQISNPTFFPPFLGHLVKVIPKTTIGVRQNKKKQNIDCAECSGIDSCGPQSCSDGSAACHERKPHLRQGGPSKKWKYFYIGLFYYLIKKETLVVHMYFTASPSTVQFVSPSVGAQSKAKKNIQSRTHILKARVWALAAVDWFSWRKNAHRQTTNATMLLFWHFHRSHWLVASTALWL